MKEFLMELYLKYGEGKFLVSKSVMDLQMWYEATKQEYLYDGGFLSWYTCLTPKAIEFLKND